MTNSALVRAATLGLCVAGAAGFVFDVAPVAQGGACVPATVQPAGTVRVGPGAQPFEFVVDGRGQTNPLCPWSPASSDAVWLTIGFEQMTGAPIPGWTGSIETTIAANDTGTSRTGHLTLRNGLGTITVVQDAAPCVNVPATVTLPRAGGTVSFAVATTTPDCAWPVADVVPGRLPGGGWFDVVQPDEYLAQYGARQAVGSGSVELRAQSNETGDGPRSIVLVIGGVPITVQQEAPLCVFSFTPTSVQMAAGGGSGAVALGGTGTNCSYAAAASAGLTITGGASGTAPSSISYTVTPTTANAPSSHSITVGGATFSVSQAGPAIATDVPTVPASSKLPPFTFPTGVSFAQYRPPTGSGFTSPAISARLTNSLTPAAGWTASADQPWVVLSPASGNTPATLRIAIDPVQAALLPEGTASATISVAAADASQGTRRIPIWLFVKTAATTVDPVGAFDTPNVLPSTMLSGAVPVTGWVHDDVGIMRIVISRAAVVGEPEGAEIYIGDGVRVHGARPDVELLRGAGAGFHFYPEAKDAGWGYMLLTNALPNGGNGTFTLHADAFDRDGRSRRLGTRTFTGDNANAIRPFGTIDAPAQGETVSGTVVNQGWVLTPSGKSIPADGSTIGVYIDGVLVGPVASFNLPRPDVKAFFPGLANSDGPGAQLTLDTTLLADGVHTIAWGVTDDAGVAEGIGSRYFTVQNGAASLVWPTAEASRSVAPLARMPVLNTDVWSRAGIDETGWAMRVATDATGRRTLRLPRGQRLELFLDPTLAAPCGSYEGHLVSGDVAGPLPMGASLDARRGVFRWQPGAEVSGVFAFTFVQRGCDSAERRIPVTVTIEDRE